MAMAARGRRPGATREARRGRPQGGRPPEGRTLLTNEIRFGATPAGRALRFTHKGSYEDVETTYDMIEVYLEAKGIVVADPIIEEFVNDPRDASDAELELNIFVQPKLPAAGR